MTTPSAPVPMAPPAPAGPLGIAIVGLGTIARAQHVPAIRADPAWHLCGVVDPAASLPGVPAYTSLADLFAAQPDCAAVALCTPPGVRLDLAREALAAGRHVLLEKPPAPSVTLAEALHRTADAAERTLFATWHSRFAPLVAPARQWLAGRRIDQVAITWREDVRVWHPGQAWLFEPGGMGVFDPGINALSIVTAILPEPLAMTRADFSIPQGRSAPIAVDLVMRHGAAPVTAQFDFREQGGEQWDIVVTTDAGLLELRRGGAELVTPEGQQSAPEAEYPAIYARFRELIARGESDVDLAPLQLVADAFLQARAVGVPDYPY